MGFNYHSNPTYAKRSFMGRRGVGPAKHGSQQPPGYVARGSYIDIEPSVVIVISPGYAFVYTGRRGAENADDASEKVALPSL